MKKLHLFFLLILMTTLLTTICLAGNVSLSTYHPAKQGAYDQLRISPRATLAGDCQSGLLYIEKSGTAPDVKTTLQFCNDNGNGNDIGTWGLLPMTWEQKNIDASTAELFLSDISRVVNAGIGTTIPTSVLTIQDQTGIDNLSITSNGSADILLVPSSDFSKEVALKAYRGNFNIRPAEYGDIAFQIDGRTGNIAIGTTPPTARLDVTGNIHATDDIVATTKITCADILETPSLSVAGTLSLAAVSIPNAMTASGDYTSNGNVNTTGIFYIGGVAQSSDLNLKKDIETISDPIAKTMGLRGVSFTWKNNNETSLGFVAQEVEDVLPEVVKTNDKGDKGVQYENILALLVETFKKQQAQIQQLRIKLDALKNK